MSREIKFRAFDKEENKMLIVTRLDFMNFADGRENKNCEGYWGDNHRKWFDKNSVEFLQYTGLLDRRGKEIYEGDIVKWGVFHKKDIPIGDFVIKQSGEEKTGEVFYERGSFHVKNFYEACQDNPCDAFEEREEFEIIGNVWENPELIK